MGTRSRLVILVLCCFLPLLGGCSVGDLGIGVGDVLGIVTTGGGAGGIFGLFGSLIGWWTKRVDEQDRRKWEKEKWAYERDMIHLQMKAKSEETEQEVKLAATAGAWKGLDTSIRHDRSIKDTSTWVNNIRGLFRPILTVLLILVVVYFFHALTKELGYESPRNLINSIGEDTARMLVVYMIHSVVFACTTAITWWFGDRAFAPPGLKNR